MNCFAPLKQGTAYDKKGRGAWSEWRWWHQRASGPRVLRHARWMQEVGYTVTVHAFDREEKHPMSENHHGVRIMRYRLGPVAFVNNQHLPHPPIPAKGCTDIGQRTSGLDLLPRRRHTSGGLRPQSITQHTVRV